VKLGPTNHAVERYIERVKPALSAVVARQELEALIEMSLPSSPTPPAWLSAFEPDTEAFLELSDGIAGAVKGNTVTTILVRATDAPVVRQLKRRRKKRSALRRNWRNGLGSQGRHKRGAAPGWG
jgi:hypothetical protein